MSGKTSLGFTFVPDHLFYESFKHFKENYYGLEMKFCHKKDIKTTLFFKIKM